MGHVAADWLAGLRRPILGGTAAYAAATARNLGAQVGVHTSAAYESGLIDLLFGAYVARVPADFTTSFENTYGADGTRRQRVESLAEPLTYEQLLPEWRSAPLVHLAPLCGELDVSLVERFPNAFLGVTPQGWLRAWDDDGLVHPIDWLEADRVLTRADAVVVSEHDVSDRAALDRWASAAKLLVVTLGQRGARVFKRGEPTPYHSQAFTPAKVLDPTGAGDVFAAAYFWRLHRTGDWRGAADWANCVASFAVEKRGPMGVPRLAEVEQRWASGRRLDAISNPAGTVA
jgi:hypothetical protein